MGGVIVYKSTQQTTSAPASPATDYALAAVKIPAGAEVVSAVASGGQISVTFKNGSTTSLRIFDGKTGAMLREVPILGE